MKEILISGYYGFKNSGDDALLSCIIDDIEKVTGTKKQIVVLSQNPEETAAAYGVRSAYRMNIFSVIAHMGNASVLISGGGTLIQDGTSTKSLLYYLAIIMLAKFFGLKTMLYANGIGPIKREKNVKRTKSVLRKVDMITLRDKRSESVLSDMGITENVHVTADPVFNMGKADIERGRVLLERAGVGRDKACFGISVRPYSGLTDDILKNIARAADEFSQKYGLCPVMLPMQTGRDEDISKKLTSYMKTKAYVLGGGMSVYDMLGVTGCMKLTLGMRLHTLIYSAVAAVPVVGLVYDPKVRGFMEYSGQDLYMDISDVTCERLLSQLDSLMENYDNTIDRLKATTEKMHSLCEDNRKYLSELL